MPFQGLPWTEFISCPVCFILFNELQQRPISLGCGHTVCKSCIRSRLNDNRCPFDQILLPNDVDKLPANFALMHLVGAAVPEQEKEAVKTVSDNPKSYEQARKCIEEMAVHLKPLAENTSDDDSSTCSEPLPIKGSHSTGSGGNNTPSNNSKCVLSRPMQRKLISLIHCQLLEEEGRSRAARIARSLGERIVSELLILHQYPHQLSANLWAAVRTRGCQFLGPAMQEEVLKLILLALEDGSFLSRKVLVLFVVQRLEARYPQASKTAIGHVVQLLYRASCFKVLKREEESSLMQLKEEFRQYESLRREHDSQIVQIAIEAGLRISPEQWSSLLYGDPAHKSHMQSIIDKHQSPQSFAQSIAELMLTLQRSSDHTGLQKLQPQLEFLSNIDPNPDCPAPSWENLEAIMRSLNTVMSTFVEFLSNPDHRSRLEAAPIQNTRYKTSMCRDFSARGTCPRGNTCTFAHSQEELERYRSRSRRNGSRGVVGISEKTSSSLTPSESDQLRQVQLISKLKMEAVAKSTCLKPLVKSHSVVELLDPKLSPSSTVIPLGQPPMGVMLPHQKPGMPLIGPMDPRLATKQLDPEKPPFIPPVPTHITDTHLTFSRSVVDSSDGTTLSAIGPPGCLYPHTANGYPQLQGPPPSSPYGGNLPVPQFPTHSLPSNPALRSAIPSLPPPMTPGHIPRNTTITRSSNVHISTEAGLPSMTMDPTSMCTGSVPCAMADGSDAVLRTLPPGYHTLPYSSQLSQGDSLEDLTNRKQEIISHLQEEPMFMDATIYNGSSAKGGYPGLTSVLASNAKSRSVESMPKHVSDMYVVTRSTQFLDDLLNEDNTPYSTRWSNGDDSAGAPDDLSYDPSARGSLPDSSTTNSISFSTAVPTSTACLNETQAGTNKLYNSFNSVPNSEPNLPVPGAGGDAEFCSFPGDDGDESFIPFEHTCVSKFGPISRMNRMKMLNSAPVQVTADMTPVVAVTPMDRPVTSSMTAPSRFSTPSQMEGMDFSVRPTPSEIPSIWNKSPQPTYSNIARLKAGAAGAVSHNERLAYELQAIELEISLKTGREPEPVRKIIQEAVMASSNHGIGQRGYAAIDFNRSISVPAVMSKPDRSKPSMNAQRTAQRF
ncbi:roquin-2-like [Physella acuta]|uniref:roquin-2-like n=1 Tax=Physella acuta TaxID=109671 RepID=UPI0027DB621E|nr:roquin-2-like [Physella acuta]